MEHVSLPGILPDLLLEKHKRIFINRTIQLKMINYCVPPPTNEINPSLWPQMKWNKEKSQTIFKCIAKFIWSACILDSQSSDLTFRNIWWKFMDTINSNFPSLYIFIQNAFIRGTRSSVFIGHRLFLSLPLTVTLYSCRLYICKCTKRFTFHAKIYNWKFISFIICIH